MCREGEGRRLLSVDRSRLGLGDPQGTECHACGVAAVRYGCLEGDVPCAGPGHLHLRRQSLESNVPLLAADKPCAGLAGKLPGRHVTARDDGKVAVDPAAPGAHGLKLRLARASSIMPSMVGKACVEWLRRDDGCDLHIRRLQRLDGVQRIRTCGQHHRGCSRLHAVVADEAAHGAMGHDAWQVIVVEDRRLLDRSRGEDELARPCAKERVTGDERQPVVLEPAVADR